MLVLTRRIDEKVVIPGVGTITVVTAKGGHVRLGFEFAKSVEVHRQEIHWKRSSEIRKCLPDSLTEEQAKIACEWIEAAIAMEHFRNRERALAFKMKNLPAFKSTVEHCNCIAEIEHNASASSVKMVR